MPEKETEINSVSISGMSTPTSGMSCSLILFSSSVSCMEIQLDSTSYLKQTLPQKLDLKLLLLLLHNKGPLTRHTPYLQLELLI